MQPASFRRARELLKDRPGAVAWVRALAVLDSLILLALLVVLGLILALLITRGNVLVLPEDRSTIPEWLSGQAPASGGEAVVLRDTSLFPIAYYNQSPRSPWIHRQLARLLRGLMARMPILRSNLAALASLLALALGLLLLWTFLAQRRRAM